MTTETGAISPDGQTVAVSSTPLPVSTRTRILMYLGVLLLVLSFGGGLVGYPLAFFLKNQLHMSAHAIAIFHLITGIPVYLGFLFGLARDSWSPFKLGDRGYLIVFGGLNAVLYAALAFAKLDSVPVLLISILVLNSVGLFISSAYNGLQAQIAQQHVMPGQMSTMLNVVGSIPALVATVAGGLLSDQLESQHGAAAARDIFLIAAVLALAIAIFGLLRPRSVYDNLRRELGPKANVLSDFLRLLRYWPVYPALLIWGLWSFAPGSNTPLQFFLQNTLHAKDSVFTNWNAIFGGSFIPTFLIYGWLSQRFPLRPLLWIGTLIGVPQMIPMAFIHSVPVSYMAAGAAGLMGGMCTAAYTDLLIRSCPRGLQGTMFMASASIYAIAVRGGDVLGASLYDKFKNFNVCVIAITVVYASILLVLLVVPKRLTATADGQTPEGGEYATS